MNIKHAKWRSLSVLVSGSVLNLLSGCGGGSIPAPDPPAPNVAVLCQPSWVGPQATSQCTASLQAGAGSAVSWSASGGTINASGLFTAPASAGSVTVTATTGQNASQTGTAMITVQLPAPASKHVVLVMEENQSYSTVVGNSTAWPHLNELIGQGALPTNYYADAHYSIPNYFMITTGQIPTTDDNSTTVWNIDNIARRMLAAKVPFKVYADGSSHGYLGTDAGLYALNHNPFALLSDVADNPQVANAVLWPFEQFADDVAAKALPPFSFIIPDLDDDAHSAPPQQADAWLQANVIAPLAGYPAFQPGGDGILIIDFDESVDSDTAHGGGHVAPVFWGPLAKAGFTQTSTTLFQHESMLRTVMEALQLSNPPGAAANAPSMSEFFVQK